MKYENKQEKKTNVFFLSSYSFANNLLILQSERFSNRGNLPLVFVFLVFQPSSIKKGWNNEHQICEIEQKSQSPHLLPRFEWWCCNYKGEKDVLRLGSWSSILNSEAASGLHCCYREFAWSFCTIQTDNCRLLQKPHRKHKFASFRQHGTEQISLWEILWLWVVL